MAKPTDRFAGVADVPPPPMRFGRDVARLTELNEGRRNRVYTDTTGNLTIGVGHNLTANGLSDRVVDLLLEEDWTAAYYALLRIDPWILFLDPVRQAAVTDLVFNLGSTRYRQFVLTREALRAGDFEQAVAELKNSRWWGQVGVRGPRLALMLITGRWPWQET